MSQSYGGTLHIWSTGVLTFLEVVPQIVWFWNLKIVILFLEDSMAWGYGSLPENGRLFPG